MLKNAYLLAKIGADTAENELNFAEILPICCWLRSRLPSGDRVVRTDEGALPPQPCAFSFGYPDDAHLWSGRDPHRKTSFMFEQKLSLKTLNSK